MDKTLKLTFILIAMICWLERGVYVCKAEPYVGWSSFAAMNKRFPCERFLASYDGVERPALSVLWGTFGKDMSCIERFMSTTQGRDRLLQIHFSNENCRKKERCLAGELMPRMSVRRFNSALELRRKRVRQAVKRRVENILAKITPLIDDRTKVILTLGLEDQFTDRAALNLKRMIKRDWNYGIVRNPLNVYSRSVARYFEYHSLYPPRREHCVYNPDGRSVRLRGDSKYRPSVSRQEFRRAVRSYCHCTGIFGWNAESQGIGEKFVAPRRRSFAFSRADSRRVNMILKFIERTCS